MREIIFLGICTEIERESIDTLGEMWGKGKAKQSGFALKARKELVMEFCFVWFQTLFECFCFSI